MEYMFQVRAKNAGGYGDPSMPEVKATPMMDSAAAGAGVQPSMVYLTPEDRNKIKVAWRYDEDVEGARSSIRFDIGWTDAAAPGGRFTSSVAPQTVRTAGGGRSARSYVLEDLKVDVSYLVAVRAVHGDANGNAIDPVVGDWTYRAVPREMTPAAASTPQNLQVMAADGALMVSWNMVASVGDCADARPTSRDCGYRVEWRAAHQGYDDPARQMDLEGHLLATSYTIPSLMNGTEYYVIVKSYNERMAAMSAPSVEARQTPMMPTPALPVFGALVLGAGLVAAGRRRLRARRQRLVKA
jgi:hypothetical protein